MSTSAPIGSSYPPPIAAAPYPQLASATPPAATYPAGPVQQADDGSYAWSAVGGAVMTVASGENLDSIAIKYGVPQNQILNANQLSSAAQVAPGKVLVIPHRVPITPGQAVPSTFAQGRDVVPVSAAPAPLPQQSVAAAAPRAPQASGATYTVMTGDTLMSISRKTGTDPDAIIALNNIGGQAQLRNGQQLKLPVSANGAAGAAGAPGIPATAAVMPATAPVMPPIAANVPRTVPAPALAPAALPAPAPTQLASNVPLPKLPAIAPVPAVTPKAPAVPAVANATQIPPTQASLTPNNGQLDDADGPSANGTTFRWPVRGRIIANFGSAPGGQRNDGINLAVPEGTSVKAAEAGTVIYAGNELEGYGNLVLIRHADGWVSAYAHNKDLTVKRGDSVVRGQVVAHAGMTGSVSAPQVHFELRQGSKPVNPLDYLSG
jgi:murein DD-endopeptidase MepM/ murein hydrolase activator NlpD